MLLSFEHSNVDGSSWTLHKPKKVTKKKTERTLVKAHPRDTFSIQRVLPSHFSQSLGAPSQRQPSLPVPATSCPTQTTSFCLIFRTTDSTRYDRQNDPRSRTTTIYLWPDISRTRRRRSSLVHHLNPIFDRSKSNRHVATVRFHDCSADRFRVAYCALKVCEATRCLIKLSPGNWSCTQRVIDW